MPWDEGVYVANVIQLSESGKYYKRCHIHNGSHQYCKRCFYLFNYGRKPSQRTRVRGICLHGNKYIYCKEPECRNFLPYHMSRTALCEPHGVRRDLCRQCGGSGLCRHDRQPAHCRDCNGSNFCPLHPQTRKHLCVPCGGSSTCKHHRQRYFCKECPGAGICPHLRRKTQCTECHRRVELKNNNVTQTVAQPTSSLEPQIPALPTAKIFSAFPINAGHFLHRNSTQQYPVCLVVVFATMIPALTLLYLFRSRIR